MGIFDLLRKKESLCIEKDAKIFSTSNIGGIKVNVSELIKSDSTRFECYAKNKYLRKFIINETCDLKISNYIVMIFNFGIVNNVSLIDDDDELNRVVIFQFKDAKKYMFDPVLQDNKRINRIENSNEFVFNIMS